ncbi:MAG TPA: cyclic nucleotide-binding domain-containing protein, partial [Acidimicrobiales bacterium]|nr:cyclic nucleotide-binding domain-containing protein [Acidimicrobiales bacterium]
MRTTSRLTRSRPISDGGTGPNPSKLEALGAVPALAHCHQRELETLAGAADECMLPRGHVLMWEGDPGVEAFLVLDGEAEVSTRGSVMAVVGRGQVLGEM